MPATPAVGAARSGVFTLAEALEAGWNAAALHRAVRNGRVDRLRPGVFRASEPAPDDGFEHARQELLAAGIAVVLACPGAALSHATAAVAHGFPVWRLPTLPCVTVPPGHTGEIPGAHVHRATTPIEHIAASGVPALSVERTVIDVGREHGALDALVVADAALHQHRTTQDHLQAQLRDCRGWPGVRAARAAVQFADGRSESPLETASRFKLDGRVPPPELQAWIYDLQGRFLGRSDFLWDEQGVVGEADGADKFDRGLTSPAATHQRQVLFEDAGLVVARWGSADLAEVDTLVERIQARFETARRMAAPRRWVARLLPRF